MTISRLRWSLLALSFFVLLFGAYAGLHWGDFLPTFSCVFVNARARTCFMLTLQQTIGIHHRQLLVFLERLLYFSFLVILIGRAWCGWICPLGFLQDALDFIREKLKVSYVRFGERVQRRLVWIKWTFLSIALLIPVWVAFPVGCPGIALNLYIPFCQICPGKYLLPLCSGNPSRVAVSFDGGTTIFMSVVGLTFSLVTFIGSFIKRRFWCSFCPLGLILSCTE
jgi:polyferredoxin